MSSELKVDTISEKTSAAGVTIDGLLIKDGAIPSISGGKILQVVQAQTTTQTQSTSTSYADTTLTASITPSATGSKVLVLIAQSFDLQSNSTQNISAAVKLVRTIGGSATDVWESNTMINMNADYGAFGYVQTTDVRPIMYLDSPSTTSATTYKTQQKIVAANTNLYAQNGSKPSQIILLEIGA